MPLVLPSSLSCKVRRARVKTFGNLFAFDTANVVDSRLWTILVDAVVGFEFRNTPRDLEVDVIYQKSNRFSFTPGFLIVLD
mmetsp:Transcript_3356/g.9326  ORF Transcript_3356/g.9326 Transcript_3356/m.9326 type:complete len:81 (-) Transcript_3356:253-495(-)